MNHGFSTPDSTKKWRQAAVLVLCLVIGVAVGTWIGRATAPNGTPRASEPQHESRSSTRETVNGVTVGYPRTERGAVDAATNFARVMASASGDERSYRAAWLTMAAPEWKDRAEELAENGHEFLRERYGDGGSFTFSPLRYRVVSYSQSSATVELWGVTVASGPKVPGIDESWLTASIELTWTSGDWRVSGQSSATGPTPELLHTDDSRPSSSLDAFKEFEHAPSP